MVLPIFAGSVRIEIKPVIPGEQAGGNVNEPEDMDTDEDWLDEALQFKDGNWPKTSKRYDWTF
jgi:hypothetical protein